MVRFVLESIRSYSGRCEVVQVMFASIGWTTNHFASKGFPGRADISSALGSFVVGLLGNLWGKAFQGTSFIVTVVPVLFQLPSGLGNGGLLNFAAANDSTNTLSNGFGVAQQLVVVAIGLVFGLFLAAVIVYPFVLFAKSFTDSDDLATDWERREVDYFHSRDIKR